MQKALPRKTKKKTGLNEYVMSPAMIKEQEKQQRKLAWLE